MEGKPLEARRTRFLLASPAVYQSVGGDEGVRAIIQRVREDCEKAKEAEVDRAESAA